MKHDLLIFDLDGTLVDSADDIAESIQQLYRETEREVPEKTEITAAIGDGVRTLIERTTPPPYDGLLEKFLPIYERGCLRQSKLYPEVLRTLEALPGKKTILSNKPEGLCKKMVTALEIGPHFEGIFGGDSFPIRKPNPKVIQNILKRHPAERPILIGDSKVDVQTALGAGIPVIAVQYGYHKPGDLDSASVRIEQFSQLIELLGRNE
ncbi:MAG: HAD-IA family hydrolase [Planctomycetota bacterium]|nr:HAD-IA family hydrolase [Planctomycetota bacterium]